jgi:serine/threonine protein kinase
MTEPGVTGSLPRTVGPYTLLEEIGKGPRGTVYRAQKEGRRLALKVVPDGVRLDLDALERFLRGTDHWIRHPNIVPLEDIGVADGMRFYAMRYLAGDPLSVVLRDLRTRSSERPSLSLLSVSDDGELHPSYLTHAIELLVQVAEGVECAHEEGISHGRISPSNLVFCPGGHLVLTDFGGEAKGRNLEPLPYRAPEQLLDDVDIETARSDVYALGAILYEFATLHPPYCDAVAPGRDSADRQATGHDVPQDDVPQDDVPQDDVPQDDVPQDDVPQDDVPQDDVPQDDGPQDVVPQDLEVLRKRIHAGKLARPSSMREEVPSSLEECILRAMAPNPEHRYSSAGRLAEDLNRFLRGEPTIAAQSLEVQKSVGDISRGTPRRLAMRFAAAAVLVALTALAFWFGSDAHDLRAWNDIHQEVLTTFNRGDRAEALAKISAVEDDRPDDPRPRQLRESLSTEAAKTHLVRATKAMVSHDVRAAMGEIRSASRFVPDEGTLSLLRREVEDLARVDPVVRDLSDPLWSVRVDALESLRQQLSSRQRPAGHTTLAAASLRAERASESEIAYAIFEEQKSGISLLEALAIGERHPPRRLDLRSFARFVEALSRIGDKDADEAGSRWSLAAMRRLDSLDAGDSIALWPNLIVEGDTLEGDAAEAGSVSGQRFFVRIWIANAPRLHPSSLSEHARELGSDDALVDDLVESLRRLGTPEAIDALESVAHERHLLVGCSAIDALEHLDAFAALGRTLASDLPATLRGTALESLGDAFLDESVVREQLVSVLQGSPFEELRESAFRYLARLDGADGWDPRPALLAALIDPNLEQGAIEWFEHIDPAWNASLAMDLLHDPRDEVRGLAVSTLSSDRDAGRFLSLVLCLGDHHSTTRKAALESLLARDDLQRLGGRVREHTTELWSRTASRIRRSIVERIDRLTPEDIARALGHLADHFLQDDE